METLWQILVFGGLMFLMMRFGCGAHMFGHGAKNKEGAHPGKGRNGCAAGDNKQVSETKNVQLRWTPPKDDKDLVCGETVYPDRAKSSVHDGLVYYFCSRECREAFEVNPCLYLGKNEGKENSPPSLSVARPPKGGGSHA